MAVKIVEGQLPFTAGDGIEITANKVIQLLLREDNNLIEINSDREAYVDLQLASGITPSSEFPAGVTVGQVLSADGWITSGTLLNFQTISGDYGRWLYGTDGHLYYDHGTGVFTQVYSKPDVDALFTQLRSELATVAFTGDYNDLINRPNIPVIGDGTLTVKQNNVSKGIFTANQIWNTLVELTDTTYPEMTVGDIGTGTSTTPSVASPKTISDYVKGKITNAYIYKGSVQTYADLPSTGLTAGDVYNVITAHTTAPVFPAGSNLAWTGTEWDVLGGIEDLSNYVTLDGTQTITGAKTFSISPVVPSKTTDATNTGTAIATEAQVYKKQDKLTTQTAYTSQGTASKVPQITTNTLGQVTGITEVNISYPSQVSDTAYGSSWDGVTDKAPSKNAVYDEIETVKSSIPTVPTNVSAFTNDAGYITSSDLPGTATSSTAGIVKLGDNTTQSTAANAVSSTASRTYAVQLNSNDQMVVNVPWTDTTTSSATSSVAGTIKLASDTTQTESAQAVSSTANRTYGLQTNASGQGVVNVPWTDTQPNNTQISFTQAGVAKGDITLNQASAETIALEGGVLCTQNAYDALPSSKTSDGNFYIIYSS